MELLKPTALQHEDHADNEVPGPETTTTVVAAGARATAIFGMVGVFALGALDPGLTMLFT
jgi:hypothetical protein